MLILYLLLANAFAQATFPAYSQQCADDAGPPFGDDEETFGEGNFYWSDSIAKAVLNEDGSCPAPMEPACQSRANPLQAFLEGPISCSNGWFCRIFGDSQHGQGGELYGDLNFANCDVPSGLWEDTDHDQSGHCHGGSDPTTFYWWVRDHWHRGYSGRLKCCCGWAPEAVANRCDYRTMVPEDMVDQCRDANEEHTGPGTGMSLGFEAGCPQNGDQVVGAYEPDDAVCWEVLKFGPPGENDSTATASDYTNSVGPCTGPGSATGNSCDGTGVFSGADAPAYTNPNPFATPAPTASATTTSLPETTSQAQYYESTSGSCPDGYAYISTSATCSLAGTALGYGSTISQTFTNTDRVRGCYVRSGSLYFNTDTTFTDTSSTSDRKSLCECVSCGNTGDDDDNEEESGSVALTVLAVFASVLGMF